MMQNVIIPLGGVLQLDDVGWDDGRDLRLRGQASRSGIPRHHALEDYQLLHEIGKALKSTVTVALCLGDWDKNNIIKTVPGATHDPKGWNRAAEIDIEKFEKYRDVLDSSEHIEFTVHGLLHGNYDENGTRINESECFKHELAADGVTKEKLLISDEYFNAHLDAFYEIYKSWGFSKKIEIYISPCGMGGITDEHMHHVAKLLYDRGIRYWTNSGFPFDGPVKVYEGVACLKQNSGMLRSFKAPWDAYDIDPETFGQYLQEDWRQNSANAGLHWTNILRYNPKNNFEQVKPWADYFDRQREVFGFMVSKTFTESANQALFYRYGKLSCEDGKYIFDLSEVEKCGFEPLKREFFISVRKGKTLVSAVCADVSLYENHNEFDTYLVKYTDTRVEIMLK